MFVFFLGLWVGAVVGIAIDRLQRWLRSVIVWTGW